MRLRHQLAVYSPITLGSCVRAAAAAMRMAPDQRTALSDLLLKEYEAESVLLCGSGTQALQVAITQACAATATREVAMPAFACFDLASAAVGADARVALFDVDADTLSPDLESLDRTLAGGARVIVVAPLYGIPVPWDSIDALAARYGAVVIEDAAQGHGATWHGRRLGSLGTISVLSFGRGKGWTGGNGGAVLFRRGAAHAMSDLISPGFGREAKTVAGLWAQWVLGRPGVYWLPRSIPSLHLGETIYHAPSPPSRLTRAAAAAILANRAASLTEAVARRTNASASIARGGAGTRFIRYGGALGGGAGYLRLPARRSEDGRQPDPRETRMGIERSYPIVLAELPALKDRLTGPEQRWPGAQLLAKELITIPTHSWTTDRPGSAGRS